MADIDWDAEEDDLYWLLYDELIAAAQIGGTAAALKLAQQGIPAVGIDWAQANERAAAWAEQYCGQLVKQVTDTTKQQVADAVATWNRTPGMTRGDLERLLLEGPGALPDLETVGGRIIPATQRAEMTAVTEVTRAYSHGGVEVMRELAVPMVEPRLIPPDDSHVGCRCTIDPYPREDGVMSWQWQTLNDDLVCEICAPLHGMDVGMSA